MCKYQINFTIAYCKTIEAEDEEHAREIIENDYCGEEVMELKIGDIYEE